MSKILLAFLGTGENGQRGYRSVTYIFDKKERISNAFVSEAIKKKCGIDKTIMVGTKGSIWEEYYKHFDKEDNDFRRALQTACQSYNGGNMETKFPENWEQEIEAKMGGGSEVVIIEKGINAEEQKQNAESLLEAVSELEDGDELYIDITHSFRSLPMYLMNCLIFLKTVRPKVKIAKILYAMMEDPYGQEAKIIDMTSVLDIYDWISGANAFINYGNSYEICKKLNDVGEINISSTLKTFSNASNVNISLPDIAKDVKNIEATDNTMVNLILNSIEDSITEIFGESKYKSDSSGLYKLAKWHYKHKNYLASLDALKESILHYVAEEYNISEDINNPESANIDNPETAKRVTHDIIRGVYLNEGDLPETFKKMNDYRNTAAHLKDSGGLSIANIDSDLNGFLADFNFIS